MKSNPKIGIIVVNWNGFSDTCECLESLLRLNYPNYKIFVVDNNSENKEADSLEKKFRNEKVEIIKNNTNLGYCGGNNIGFARAKADGFEYTVILNNDTVVEENLLNSLIAKFDDDDIYAVGATIVEYSDRNTIQSRGMLINKSNFTTQFIDHHKKVNSEQIDVANSVSGCCFMVDNDKFDKELFDERFFCYYEENDLCLTIIERGGRISIAKDALVYHKVAISSNKLSGFSEYQMTKNIFLLQRKHAKGFQKILSFLRDFKDFLYRIKLMLKHKQLWIGPHIIRGYCHGLLIFMGVNPNKFRYKLSSRKTRLFFL